MKGNLIVGMAKRIKKQIVLLRKVFIYIVEVRMFLSLIKIGLVVNVSYIFLKERHLKCVYI